MKNKIKSTNPIIDKNVSRLIGPTKRSKQALKNMLEKNLKRLQGQAEKLTSEEEKSIFLKKNERLSKDLALLKALSDDEIIKYALLRSNKIMSLASNLRVPRAERMKARVAAHKPLSTHLRRLNQKLTKPQETESESESEKQKEQNSSGSTLNKITFNNTIVQMRKDVRRAKVHIIHKLTRNIKKLRSAKGDEEKVAKFQSKADRLHKKVVHIKEQHEDEISKFALSTTQNINKLAFDVKAPTISQALATVALNKFVAAQVSSFRSKYPDWQKIVPNLLKKKPKKRKLNLEPKDVKNGSSELSNENHESDNETSGSENGVSETEHSAENSSSDDDNEEETEDVINTTSQDKSDQDVGDSDEEVSDADDSSVNNVEIIKQSKPKENVSNSTKEKCKTPLNKKVSKLKEPTNVTFSSSELGEAKPPKNKPKVVDPFFITTTNKEYETSQVPLSVENTNRKTENFEERRPRKFNSFDMSSKWERTNSEGRHGKYSRFQNSSPYNQRNPSNFQNYTAGPKTDKIVFGNRKERRKSLHQPPVEEKVEKLHPSWEAKKKHSVIIPFQGKKVTFD